MSQYELYSVVNHQLLPNQGGHYTSSILFEEAGAKDYNQGSSVGFSSSGFKPPKQTWFTCNDSVVLKQDKEAIISKDAYILFYKRREFTASNVVNLKNVEVI
jgi:ubiquitin C-terminal hydrolase